MGQFDLNLSTRPFKPYRAVNLGLFVLLVILGLISAAQVLSYQQYSGLAAESRAVEMNVREESDLLAREIQRMEAELVKGDAQAKLAEVELLNTLILKKSFKWTSVFASLERAKGENVRLVSLRPFVDSEGRTGLNMDIRGRSLPDATEFLRTLEASSVFTDVVLAVTEEPRTNVGNVGGEVAFTLSSYYTPPENKPRESKPAGGKPTEGKPAGNKPAETKARAAK
jgi:hypothetical protein